MMTLCSFPSFPSMAVIRQDASFADLYVFTGAEGSCHHIDDQMSPELTVCSWLLLFLSLLLCAVICLSVKHFVSAVQTIVP